MSSDELLGFDAILDGLWRAAREGRLAHALLLRGPAGIGKFHALGRLAAGLLCARGPGPACGACGPCKRARAGAHPDLLVIDPVAREWEVIPIAAITPRDKQTEVAARESIGEFLSLRALEGGWKIVIVREAERMNEAAQNAFLKTLEEPSPGTLLALETSAPESLLPTVHSRLVGVRCRALETEQVLAILARHGLEPADAAICAALARGSPGRALALARQGAPAVLALVEAVERGQAGAVEAARAIAELPGEHPGRTPSAQARSRARALLDVLLVRTAERARESGEPIPRRRFERWLQARADVDSNLSPGVILERALLALEPPGTLLTRGDR